MNLCICCAVVPVFAGVVVQELQILSVQSHVGVILSESFTFHVKLMRASHNSRANTFLCMPLSLFFGAMQESESWKIQKLEVGRHIHT